MAGSFRSSRRMSRGPWMIVPRMEAAPVLRSWCCSVVGGSGGVDLQGGRAGPVLDEVVDDRGVVAVRAPVGRIHSGQVGGGRLGEGHVVCRAAGDHLSLTGGGRAAEPGRRPSVGGADEDARGVADDPDRPRPPEGAVAVTGPHLHLLGCGDPGGVGGIPGHALCSFRTMRARVATRHRASRQVPAVRAVETSPARAVVRSTGPLPARAETATRRARPRAMPSWWAVLTRPEAAPARSAVTPLTPADVSGAKARPCPAPMRTMGSATAVR